MDTIKEYIGKWNSFPQPQKVKYLKLLACGCYTLFLLFFVIYAFGGTRSARSHPQSIVLFLEAMPYALESLRYLSLRRDVSIAMIVVTVNSWSVDAFQSVILMSSFVEMLRSEGLPQAIPVYYGNSMALVDENFSTSIDFSKNSNAEASLSTCSYRCVLSGKEHFEAARLFQASTSLLQQTMPSSMEFFADNLNALLNDVKATFLVLGPATDASFFLREYPQQRSKVTRVVLAGGSFQLGNVRWVYAKNRLSELNFFMDPLAAGSITSGQFGDIPVTVIPLDAVFPWNQDTYSERITALASKYQLGEKNSSTLTAYSVSNFHQSFSALSKNISVSLLATVYAVDSSLQASSKVSLFPVVVTNTRQLPYAGRSIYYPEETFSSVVLLEVKQNVFWNILKLTEGLLLNA